MGSNESRFGYRVIEIQAGSPGEQAGLKLYLDFIISINGTDLLSSQTPFQDLIKTNENCTITLGVLSIENMEVRELQVTPLQWEGEGLLGVSLRYEDASEALNNIMHVTKVFPDMPASNSGLLENEYILGSAEVKLKDSQHLRDYLSANGAVTLIVYNSTTKETRKVLLQSTDGSIGIEIAVGVLHRISES